MTYQDVLDWMFTQLPVYQRDGKSAYKANLDNTHALMDVLGHPYRRFKSIHVAGTNGKGSCSHMLASVLQEAGYKTGLYTSPHLKDYRERIRVNGHLISEDFVIDLVNKYRSDFESIRASFFEMTVGLAFAYFAEQAVDIAIIETGLGGRLDSTNVITPVLSVITNIGMDHTQFLGDSMEAIAAEKAGIIKRHVPVVIGEHQVQTDAVFETMAAKQQAPVTFAQDQLKVVKKEQSYTVTIQDTGADLHFELPLLGNYQLHNVTTVTAAALLLQLPHKSIESGLAKVVENTALQGRWQVLKQQPLCIADTAHNKDGLLLVMEQLKRLQYNKLHIVLAVVNDKSLSGILPLFPKEATYYFSQANIPRALPVEDLLTACRAHHMLGEAYPSVKEAYAAALANACTEDVVFVGGSTFTVAEVL